jgi:hypothetical protein
MKTPGFIYSTLAMFGFMEMKDDVFTLTNPNNDSPKYQGGDSTRCKNKGSSKCAHRIKKSTYKKRKIRIRMQKHSRIMNRIY